MRRYRLGAHTKTDLKVHLIWIPKYRKRVLVGPVAVRARDILRQVAMEHELEIITGKVAVDQCAYISRVPADAEYQQDGTVVERDEFKGIAAGVCAFAEAVLGSTFLGTWIFGSEFGESYG